MNKHYSVQWLHHVSLPTSAVWMLAGALSALQVSCANWPFCSKISIVPRGAQHITGAHPSRHGGCSFCFVHFRVLRPHWGVWAMIGCLGGKCVPCSSMVIAAVIHRRDGLGPDVDSCSVLELGCEVLHCPGVRVWGFAASWGTDVGLCSILELGHGVLQCPAAWM